MPTNDTTRRSKAFKALNISSDHKLILSLDGGGIRGILTLQLLKKIEEIAQMPCYELFDMVAGTSTGGIIAGLFAASKSATEVEKLYKKLVTKVFKKRDWKANRFLNPPLYDKENYRTALKELIGNISMEEAVQQSKVDLLITAKDITAGEEAFFGCFIDMENTAIGTYKDVLLRSVMEATMSAPTYFTPLERFVDGGSTTYNNPTLSAIMEAVHYGPMNKYDLDKLTVFSFGTGTTVQYIKPDQTYNPKGIDAMFWLNLIMAESSRDASDMQNNLIRSGLIPKLDYRRFQISFDRAAIHKIPNKSIAEIDDTKENWLWDLTNEELLGIELDDVGRFPLMEIIGQSMTEFIMQSGGAFKNDLCDTIKKRDLLVTSFGDVARIKAQMQDPDWLDNYES